MAAASARLVGQQARRQAEKDPARLVLPSIFATVTDDGPELAGEQRSELEVDAARYKEPASVLAGLPLSAEQAETIRRMLQPFAADRGAGLTGDMSGGLWRTLRNMGLSTNLTGEIMRRASAHLYANRGAGGHGLPQSVRSRIAKSEGEPMFDLDAAVEGLRKAKKRIATGPRGGKIVGYTQKDGKQVAIYERPGGDGGAGGGEDDAAEPKKRGRLGIPKADPITTGQWKDAANSTPEDVLKVVVRAAEREVKRAKTPEARKAALEKLEALTAAKDGHDDQRAARAARSAAVNALRDKATELEREGGPHSVIEAMMLHAQATALSREDLPGGTTGRQKAEDKKDAGDVDAGTEADAEDSPAEVEAGAEEVAADSPEGEAEADASKDAQAAPVDVPPSERLPESDAPDPEDAPAKAAPAVDAEPLSPDGDDGDLEAEGDPGIDSQSKADLAELAEIKVQLKGMFEELDRIEHLITSEYVPLFNQMKADLRRALEQATSRGKGSGAGGKNSGTVTPLGFLWEKIQAFVQFITKMAAAGVKAASGAVKRGMAKRKAKKADAAKGGDAPPVDDEQTRKSLRVLGQYHDAVGGLAKSGAGHIPMRILDGMFDLLREAQASSEMDDVVEMAESWSDYDGGEGDATGAVFDILATLRPTRERFILFKDDERVGSWYAGTPRAEPARRRPGQNPTLDAFDEYIAGGGTLSQLPEGLPGYRAELERGAGDAKPTAAQLNYASGLLDDVTAGEWRAKTGKVSKPTRGRLAEMERRNVSRTIADLADLARGCDSAPMLKADDEVEIDESLGERLYATQGVTKGAGHKYIRRVPKAGGGFRYYYKVSGVTRDVGADLVEGAAFKIGHDGKEGHFHVTGRDGDKVTLRHDESGKEMTVDAAALGAMLQREHAEVVGVKRESLKREIAQAEKTGSAKQRERLHAEAERLGVGSETGTYGDATKLSAKEWAALPPGTNIYSGDPNDRDAVIFQRTPNGWKMGYGERVASSWAHSKVKEWAEDRGIQIDYRTQANPVLPPKRTASANISASVPSATTATQAAQFESEAEALEAQAAAEGARLQAWQSSGNTKTKASAARFDRFIKDNANLVKLRERAKAARLQADKAAAPTAPSVASKTNTAPLNLTRIESYPVGSVIANKRGQAIYEMKERPWGSGGQWTRIEDNQPVDGQDIRNETLRLRTDKFDYTVSYGDGAPDWLLNDTASVDRPYKRPKGLPRHTAQAKFEPEKIHNYPVGTDLRKRGKLLATRYANGWFNESGEKVTPQSLKQQANITDTRDVYTEASAHPGESRVATKTGDRPMVKAARDIATLAALAADLATEQPTPTDLRKAIEGMVTAEGFPLHPGISEMVLPGGVRVKVETPRGGVRRGTDMDGRAWAVVMPAHYGEFADTLGTDGDPVDVFVGDSLHAPYVYVIALKDPATGLHDEDKVLFGFASRADALACYRAAYDRRDLLLDVRRLTVPEFQTWLAGNGRAGERIAGGRQLRRSMAALHAAAGFAPQAPPRGTLAALESAREWRQAPNRLRGTEGGERVTPRVIVAPIAKSARVATAPAPAIPTVSPSRALASMLARGRQR